MHPSGTVVMYDFELFVLQINCREASGNEDTIVEVSREVSDEVYQIHSLKTHSKIR